MNSDFKDLLRILSEEEVRYLIVGGYAVIYHGQPRSTKDLDLWLEPTQANASKVVRAFQRFGLPLMGGVTEEDFANEGLQYAVGVAPGMIGFPTSVPGLNFGECWKNRVSEDTPDGPYIFLGKEDLIRCKQVAGRPQDLVDIDELNRT